MKALRASMLPGELLAIGLQVPQSHEAILIVGQEGEMAIGRNGKITGRVLHACGLKIQRLDQRRPVDVPQRYGMLIAEQQRLATSADKGH